ncbi:hypothetical protein ACEPAI_6992 [Sanghuangporus weigelae]
MPNVDSAALLRLSVTTPLPLASCPSSHSIPTTSEAQRATDSAKRRYLLNNKNYLPHSPSTSCRSYWRLNVDVVVNSVKERHDLESSALRLSDQKNLQSEMKPMKASSPRSVEMYSAEQLRHVRETRYSRDQEMLCANLSCCAKEPSEKQLQISALERIKQELEIRLHDCDRRASELRDRLGGQIDSDKQSRESLLRQRLIVEHRLTTTREEVAAVTKELERLMFNGHCSTIDSTDPATTSYLGRSRNSANLSLFFRDSATRKPLRTSMRSYSMNYDTRPRMPHWRSKSLAEDYSLRELRGKEGSRAGIISSSSVLDQGQPCSSSGQFPLAVDEFNNSFSSRVIDPSRSRPQPRSSLRPLQMPSREWRNMFATYSRRSSVDGEFGNATLLPIEAPRSTTEVLEDLSSTPLPSYVQTLINEFEQFSHPPLALSFVEDRILDSPVLRKPAPLSPVLEQPSSISSIKSRPSPKAAGRKLVRKRQPIFTLRLPSHPSAQGSPSFAESSSTSIDASSEEQPLPLPLIDSRAPSRRKGLPSTRDHDLAMLGGAPDDVPETTIPFTPKASVVGKSIVARPFSVLRRVKSRLVQLGRH